MGSSEPKGFGGEGVQPGAGDGRGEGHPEPARWLDNLAPYDPVSSLEKIWARPQQVPFKLDWNESTIPPSPGVYQAIVRFLSHSNHLNWYPELGSRSLCHALSAYVDLPPEDILVTNGSDDALELVCKTYLEPGNKFVVPMPTYTHFLVYVEARGAEVVPFYSSDLFDAGVDDLADVISDDTKLVYLVNPNNPTGVTYRADRVARLLERYPRTLFLVDEAYFEFHGESVVGLVGHFDNIVVTRTFSKCFGIAGLRMGYLCTGPATMRQLKKLFNPKSVNRLGQIAAMACLQDLEYYRNFVREVTEAKEIFRSAMARRGLNVIVTPANFVNMKVPDPARFCLLLEEEGIYVRDRSSLPRMESYVRVSIPSVSQVHEVIRRIDRVLARL
ncbi:MAG: histidinol-phosphate aminotransferase family protein [Deltaproteobacteria bacterium]|nr:histidinol-phosphate aminotransferase family protein [Deltaproteobacteria bacterium]